VAEAGDKQGEGRRGRRLATSRERERKAGGSRRRAGRGKERQAVAGDKQGEGKRQGRGEEDGKGGTGSGWRRARRGVDCRRRAVREREGEGGVV